ncbi:serine/threonine-protein kinase SRPK3 [Seiridium cupressi]
MYNESLYGDILEDVERYREGGFHPIHLNDVLNDRFEVLHKLGYGGFGTVWLCWDQTHSKWCAVKVLAADHSKNGREQEILDHLTSNASIDELARRHIVVPSEVFWVEGPNGRHLCQVLPLLGSNVEGWRLFQRYKDENAMAKVKDVCYQIADGMAYLHRNDICHNDFRPHNILMKLDGIDALGKEELLKTLDEPETIEVETLSGDDPAPHGPKYCVEPLQFSWCKTYMKPEIAIIDFGESFLVNKPRPRSGIPIQYAAPEVLFSGTHVPSLSSDVWSLGVTLFDIYNSTDLLGDKAFSSGVDASIETMEVLLGPLPEPYRAVWFRDFQIGDSDSTDGRNKPGGITRPVYWDIATLEDLRKDKATKTGYLAPFEASLAYHLNRMKGLGDQFPPLEELRSSQTYPLENRYILDFANLLEKIIRYDPKERISITDVLVHPWFGKANQDYYAVKLPAWRQKRLILQVTIHGREQRERHDDDEHVTVRMGQREDKAQMSGHIYLIEEDLPKDYSGPRYKGYSKIIRLMTDDERTVVGGRGIELYIWEPYKRVRDPNGPPEPTPHPQAPFQKKKGQEFQVPVGPYYLIEQVLHQFAISRPLLELFDPVVYFRSLNQGANMSQSGRTQGASSQSDDEVIYQPAIFEGIEDLQRYNKGGFHPVLIGDFLDGRFEVHYKLGSGGFGTVWLCWDMKFEKWRAVKVTAADHSAMGSEAKIIEHLKDGTSTEELARNHIVSPLEHFWVEGPNGRHLCYVLELYGCTISAWRWALEEDDGVHKDIRTVCHQIVKGMGYIHNRGLEELTKEELVELIGNAEAEDIGTVSGEDPGSRAPEYYVIPLSSDWCEKFIVPEIVITDFGESFLAKSPRDTTGIPTPYAAPEILLPETSLLGFGTDIWSLACTIYEVWEGDPIFAMNRLSEVVHSLEFFLGPLPKPFRSAWRKRGSQEESSSGKSYPQVGGLTPLTWDIDALNESRTEDISGTGYSDIMEAHIARSVNCLKGNADRLPPLKELQSLATFPEERYHITMLADLLKKMLRYNPEKRLRATSVMSHPWFKDTTRLPLSYRVRQIRIHEMKPCLWLLSVIPIMVVVGVLVVYHRPSQPRAMRLSFTNSAGSLVDVFYFKYFCHAK